MMTIEQLHSEAFLERVQRSADYFSEALISILSKPLSLALAAKSENKYAMKRMKDVGGDLKIQWRTKVLLLQSMGEKPFLQPYILMKSARL